jgi:hypothetical protein
VGGRSPKYIDIFARPLQGARGASNEPGGSWFSIGAGRCSPSDVRLRLRPEEPFHRLRYVPQDGIMSRPASDMTEEEHSAITTHSHLV